MTPGGHWGSQEEDQTGSYRLDYVTDFGQSIKESWKATEKLQQRKWVERKSRREARRLLC